MKPAPFEYRVASDLAAAKSMLAEAGGDAKLVSGSQSLGPMLNLRLARPELLVDISTLLELQQVREGEHSVQIGAGITHAQIEDGEAPDPTGGWLRAAAGNIAHRAVRNRGTLGGSLAHADPAADWVIVMIGLGANAVVDGPSGRRTIAMKDFITGPFATALGAGEILVAVEIARPGPDARWGYWKFCRQVGEFAKASATVLVDPKADRYRCAVGALGGPPVVLDDAQAIIEARMSPTDALVRALPERPRESLSLHIAALERALSLAQSCGQAAS
jgi:aerobic carbon-monoxide dehydrogenase medium subunit